MGEQIGRSQVYMDHAATSFPKPEEVSRAVDEFLRVSAGNPGRSGHRLSAGAARMVFETREAFSHRFGVDDSRRVIFVPGATAGLNLVLFGLLDPGDHVVTTSMEHNAVMRPLRFLADTRDVTVTVVPASPEGLVDPDDLARAVKPGTRLAIVNHASNVCGALQPLPDIGRRLDGKVPLVVDAAQTGGLVPLDLEGLGVGALAVSGHKGLMGPAGIGVLCLADDVRPRPLIHGGTGSASEFDTQPDFLPDCYEAGTPNTPGIAGLGGGLRFLERVGSERVLAHERTLTARFLEALDDLPKVTVYGPRAIERRTGTVSLTVRGVDPGDVSGRLDREYGFWIRSGLHCAPNAHRTLGTFPRGSVRISFGLSNTSEEVDRLAEGLAEIAHG